MVWPHRIARLQSIQRVSPASPASPASLDVFSITDNNNSFMTLFWDYPGEPVPEETPTHHPDHHPIFISFFHLPPSIASSLF